MSNDEKLVAMYKEMAELTLPKCKKCRSPLSCCSGEYCEFALKYAKEEWNVDLLPIFKADQDLPFMGETGCMIAPHFRPMCTLHVCSISSFGFDPKDPEWTKKYFSLREKVNELDYEREKSRKT